MRVVLGNNFSVCKMLDKTTILESIICLYGGVRMKPKRNHLHMTTFAPFHHHFLFYALFLCLLGHDFHIKFL